MAADVNQGAQVEQIAEGVWRIRFGTPERFTPGSMREKEPEVDAINQLPLPGPLPFQLDEIIGDVRPSRTVVRIPCDEPADQIYGFGLDALAYEQKGLRKYLSVCSGSISKTGAGHGPVPFYVSTKGYGVWVDTARVPFVHVAYLSHKASATAARRDDSELKTSETELYAARKAHGRPEVIFDIPAAQGVDVYVFGGPTLREAVQRYNLFSGGGCVPPMWGLGMKYRTYTLADQATVMTHAQALREMDIPCDVIGLEPGWQSNAYSCSLIWFERRFPAHQQMVDELREMGYHLNLWEHAYIHPTSPLFEPLKEHSGDFVVWGGLVVDFADPEAFRLFADHHEFELVDKGITGFKADECDHQPLTDCTPFNYPYCSAFPSGIDGDQMTQMYGYLQQRSIYSVFKKKNMRTWGDVRATTSLAAPLPFNLYSDAYAFDQYLRQLVNASFTGLLWSPEVREAKTETELFNRIAMSSYAPQMCLDQWFMPHPFWQQYVCDKNKEDILLPETDQQRVAARVREIVNRRMALLPYLYASFFRYRQEGLPPVRSLLVEFPDDVNLRTLDSAYMFGDNLLVAPFMGELCSREVYFPLGCNWVDIHTDIVYPGGSSHTFTNQPGDVPVFVKENTILPLAKPVQQVDRDTVFELTVKVYGDVPDTFVLIEDDGETFEHEKGLFNRLTLAWREGAGSSERQGSYSSQRYRVVSWDKVSLKRQ